MATQPQGEDDRKIDADQQEESPLGIGWVGKIEEQYRRVKEHAETYPYVWGSYILVYGGFGLWLTYRWRKLRKTEDRVRALQQKLHQLVEEENRANATVKQSTKSASLSDKPPTGEANK